MYNTTTACIIYLDLLRGSNDLTTTTGGSLAWNSDANTTCLSMDCIFSLTFYAWTFCFVDLPLVLSPWATRPPTGHGLLGGGGHGPPAPSPRLCIRHCGEADQINWSACLNSETVICNYDKSPALSETWQSSGLRSAELRPWSGDEVKAICLSKIENWKRWKR